MDQKIIDYRAEITAQLIEALEKGTAPWQRPWSAAYAPQNAVTGHIYKGVNAIYLAFLGFTRYDGSDPRWLTFAQAKEKGWHVRKGEKGVRVIFWGQVVKEVKDGDGKPVLDKDGKPQTTSYPVAKFYTVFHASQVEGLPEYAPELNEVPPVEVAERIISDSGAEIRHGGNQAYYNPASDEVTLPPRETFKDAASYYATALHELGHWTGHESRLNREMCGCKQSKVYAREELVAELTSVFVSMETGIPQTPEHFEQHAAYVGHWAQLLRDDPDALFKAASDASKAAEYLLKGERERAKKEEAAAA